MIALLTRTQKLKKESAAEQKRSAAYIEAVELEGEMKDAKIKNAKLAFDDLIFETQAQMRKACDELNKEHKEELLAMQARHAEELKSLNSYFSKIATENETIHRLSKRGMATEVAGLKEKVRELGVCLLYQTLYLHNTYY